MHITLLSMCNSIIDYAPNIAEGYNATVWRAEGGGACTGLQEGWTIPLLHRYHLYSPIRQGLACKICALCSNYCSQQNPVRYDQCTLTKVSLICEL